MLTDYQWCMHGHSGIDSWCLAITHGLRALQCTKFQSFVRIDMLEARHILKMDF